MARQATPQLTARMNGVRSTVAARLDRLGAYLPEPRAPKLDFTEYLARASARAMQDPVFKERLAAALQQYQAAGSVFDGSTRR